MPDLTYTVTTAQATRIGTALRGIPDKNGATPAANATAAEVWAHAKRVAGRHIVALVKQVEAGTADELDTMGT